VRLLLPLLLLVACAPAPAPEATPQPLVEAPKPKREPLLHVDVPAKAAAGRDDFVADWSFDLVDRPEWSLHAHVVPEGQLIPWHRHAANDELVFVASGTAELLGWWKDGEGREAKPSGSVFGATKNAVHGTRNRGPGDLATVVLQRPRFGQNWFLEREDVDSPTAPWTWAAGGAPLSMAGGEAAPGFDGWTLGWAALGPREARAADTVYFVAAGEGSLAFEGKRLPLAPGVVAVVPPTLAHELAGTATVFEAVIPR
jgi:mannose-6-phosphate isomerase-like protein (cupin superfamily)